MIARNVTSRFALPAIMLLVFAAFGGSSPATGLPSGAPVASQTDDGSMAPPNGSLAAGPFDLTTATDPIIAAAVEEAAPHVEPVAPKTPRRPATTRAPRQRSRALPG